MATRSLTEVFILMRNNAMQNRHLFSDQNLDDRTALVGGSSRDAELGYGRGGVNKLPPEWIDSVEEVQYEMSRIKQKVKELSVLHDKHLNRPTLDDSIDEEHGIEIHTRDITQMFSRCQQLVRQINSRGSHTSPLERKITKNITSSFARELTDLSTSFKKGQSTYLRRLKSREENASKYFDTGMENNLMGEEDEVYDRGFTDMQLRMVEDNSIVVQQREKEVTHIVRSIHDLNEIFKDLATMVVDQGTILDRIDFNLEQTQTKVETGLEQLQKAEKYQKNNKKMLIIVILACIVVFMIILLIAVKH